MTKPKKDKRYKERVPIQEKVKIQAPDEDTLLEEYADNISLGGMFIKTDKPFPTGTRFSLELSIGYNGKKIAGEGEVVWTKEFSSSSDERPSGMGIKFVELKEQSKSVIKELMKKSE